MTPDGIARLKTDEGKRNFPYYDTATPPRLSIGFGRNLTDVGISDDEAAYLLANDIAKVVAGLSAYAWWAQLSPVRQDACINMAYNLGLHGFSTFRNMIAALAVGDYPKAAAEMLDSGAARELPSRYGRLAQALETDTWGETA